LVAVGLANKDYRLTNSSPFIDPDYTTDVKTKILERYIDWPTLHQMNVSPAGLSGLHLFPGCSDTCFEAVGFITRLLDQNPETRMTLKDALDHDWFVSLRNDRREATATPEPEASQPSQGQYLGVNPDVSMRDARSEEPSGDPPSSQSNNNYPVPGAYPTGSQSQSQSQDRALQRRRKILDDARDRGIQPPEPTPEMIQNVQRAEGALDDTAVRPLKRKANDEFDSSLSPMPEDDEDADMVPEEPGPSRKGGKGAAGPSAKRGPRAGRTRGVKASAAQDGEESPRVRRSNRLGGH
jgi:ser/thr/tyr protein kinase RAD53